jgi:hypothetical protein
MKTKLKERFYGATEILLRKQKRNKKVCLSPGSNWGPLVCETNVITNYTTQTVWFCVLYSRTS